jgi:hypothetical protein
MKGFDAMRERTRPIPNGDGAEVALLDKIGGNEAKFRYGVSINQFI